MRRFIFKRKHIPFFETKPAILCITIGYVNLKTPFLLYPFFHLSPSFAVLSEEISILLIAPH